MKKSLIVWIVPILFCLAMSGHSQAEQWVPILKQTPIAFYDRDSIQFPKLSVYDLGLFTMGKVDKDIIRVWTRLDVSEKETTRILYEIKFSGRIYKAIYAVDRYGNRTLPFDEGYKPIIPDSLESNLFEMVKAEAGLEQNRYPLPDRFLDASD